MKVHTSALVVKARPSNVIKCIKGKHVAVVLVMSGSAQKSDSAAEYFLTRRVAQTVDKKKRQHFSAARDHWLNGPNAKNSS